MTPKISQKLTSIVEKSYEFNRTLEIEKADGIPLNTPGDYIKNARNIILRLAVELGFDVAEISIATSIVNGENNISKVIYTKKYGEVFFKLDLISTNKRIATLRLSGRGIQKEVVIYRQILGGKAPEYLLTPGFIDGSISDRWLVLDVLSPTKTLSFKDKFIPSSSIAKKDVELILGGIADTQSLQIPLGNDDVTNHIPVFDESRIRKWYDLTAPFVYLFFPAWQEYLEELVFSSRTSYRPTTFCHGDISLQNIAMQGDKVIFFDWEKSQFNSPHHDFCHLYVQLGLYPDVQEHAKAWYLSKNTLAPYDYDLLLSSLAIRLIVEVAHILDGYGPCRLVPLLDSGDKQLHVVSQNYLESLIVLSKKLQNREF